MATPKKREFDPIELELLWRRLISMVDEAAAAMVRTSFSTLVRESYDFSCVITDAAGQSLVQASESIPSFIGTLPETVKHFLRFFPPDQLAPGDVLITNDIWLGTGHLPDITLAKPIFKDGTLVAFSATTAHAPDIGGKIRSPEPREVFEEGLQIPPMKMIAAGRTDETLVTIIRKNVRTPDQTMGDLWAQVVALDLMEDRLRVLMEGYGLPDLTDLAREIQGRCETAMRSAIRELPDGTYRSELQTDGLMDKPITLKLALTIKGDEILMDFAGTDCPGRPRHQLRALLHQRHGDVRGEGLHQPRPAQQRRRLAADHAQGAAGLHRQSAIPRTGRLAHADRPLRADAGVRLPGPDRAGAGDGGLRLADVGHEPVGCARRRQALRQHVLLQRRHGRQHAARRRDVPLLAVQRLLDLDRDQRAHRAAALPSQEAAARLGRPRPSSRRAGSGDPDRKPQRDADRRLLPRRTHASFPPSASKAARTARRASCASTARRPTPRSSTS